MENLSSAQGRYMVTSRHELHNVLNELELKRPKNGCDNETLRQTRITLLNQLKQSTTYNIQHSEWTARGKSLFLAPGRAIRINYIVTCGCVSRARPTCLKRKNLVIFWV